MNTLLEPIEPPPLARDAQFALQEENRQLRAFLESTLHELSQPISALWCALELAALRRDDPEEDRQDLLAAFALAEILGKRLRGIQDVLDSRFASTAQPGSAGKRMSTSISFNGVRAEKGRCGDEASQPSARTSPDV